MTQTRDEILAKLAEILAEQGKSAAPNDQLIGSGILDSLDMLDLVEAIEQHFGIALDQSLINLENFGSLTQIASLIERIRG